MSNNKQIQHFYDSTIADRYENDYEFNRWFKNDRLRADFYMTYEATRYHVSKLKFSNCLELGPGPGTWTRVLYKAQPNASYHLIDISKEMKRQFELEMRGGERVQYSVSDIMNTPPDKTYDFFFSSRAIEYLDDQKAFFELLPSFMKQNAQGMIITKNPLFGFRKRKEERFQHQGQITPQTCKEALEKVGFHDITVYPVIIRTPLTDRVTSKVSDAIFKRVYQQPLEGTVLEKMTESYLIHFTKA